MARQKGISISRLKEIIDLMRDERVAKLSIPGTVDIIMFEPEKKITPDFDMPDISSENEETSDTDLLLYSSR